MSLDRERPAIVVAIARNGVIGTSQRKCATCNGAGEVLPGESAPVPKLERSPTYNDLVLCAVCKGTGLVGNALPWSFPEDLRRFREITMGSAVIMGRRTFESIGKVLPGRQNIVITRDEAWARRTWDRVYRTRVDGRDTTFEIVHAQMGALTVAVTSAHYANRKPYVIGGADLYRQALLSASEMHVTRVDVDALGDVYFPLWDATQWRCVERNAGQTRELTFERWVRR